MLSLLALRTNSFSKRSRTLAITVLGLGAVLGLGLWDIRHDDQIALQQLTQEQQRLASTIANQISLVRYGTALDAVEWLSADVDSHLVQVPKNDTHVVLLAESTTGKFWVRRQQWLAIPELASALAHHESGAVLSRDAAALLGLPRRIAVAGLAALHESTGQFSAVIVVSSAEAERDRSRREQWRSVLGIVIASGLVLVAGVGALKTQKRELELDRQLALRRIGRDRDAELARANRMATIAALSSGIAHEISTPLAVIAGKIELLLTVTKGQDRVTSALSMVANQVDRIDTIMRGFLAFARGDAPLLVQREASEIAQTVVQLVAHRFVDSGVALEHKPCTYAPMIIACEPALFEQSLINILVNACDASAKGSRVIFSVNCDEENVYFRVSDEGVGIPESVIARVTDPFFTTKSSKGGSGLGLAIAKEILAHHRGSLTFELRQITESKTQPGTRVTVQIPRIKENHVEIVA